MPALRIKVGLVVKPLTERLREASPMAPASAPSMNSLMRRPAALSFSITAASFTISDRPCDQTGLGLAGFGRFVNRILSACQGNRVKGIFSGAGVPARLPAPAGVAYAPEICRRMDLCRLWRQAGGDARPTDGCKNVGKFIHPIALCLRGAALWCSV